MISVRQIKDKTMSNEKKKSAKNDFFAFYIGRPISYVLTIPFLYLKFSPKTVSILSIFPLFLGLYFFYIGHTKLIFIIGWIMFFIWNLLDGVDGNIARYNNVASKTGSVYDAMSGYFAMMLSFLGMGIVAANSVEAFSIGFSRELYIIFGCLSGFFVILPRLVMHKMLSTFLDESITSSVKDKSNFGILKIIALNLNSISGGAQVLMLVAIVFNISNLFTIGYLILNLLIMIVSLKSIFSEE